jgi:hypothetical protein
LISAVSNGHEFNNSSEGFVLFPKATTLSHQ